MTAEMTQLLSELEDLRRQNTLLTNKVGTRDNIINSISDRIDVLSTACHDTITVLGKLTDAIEANSQEPSLRHKD